MDGSSRRSIGQFKDIEGELTKNIEGLDQALQDKFQDIQSSIQQHIETSKNLLQNYIKTIISELTSYQKTIKDQLNKTIEGVKTHLEKYVSGVNELEEKVKEIEQSLKCIEEKKKVLEQYKDKPKEYFLKSSLLSDSFINEIKKRITRFAKDGNIDKLINLIRPKLQIVKNIIRVQSIYRDIINTKINPPSQDSQIVDYEKVKGDIHKVIHAFKGYNPNRLEGVSRTIRGHFSLIEGRMNSLVKLKDRVQTSGYIKKTLRTPIYKILNELDTNKNKIKTNLSEIKKEDKGLVKNYIDPSNKKYGYIKAYIEIHKAVEKIKRELTKYQENLEGLDPNKLDTHFSTIKTQKDKLTEPEDPVTSQSTNILEYKTQLTEMKALWDKLKPINTNVGSLNFITLTTFELDKDSQDITTNITTLGDIHGLQPVLDNLVNKIDKLEKMKQILENKGDISTNQSSLSEFETELNKLNCHIDKIISPLETIKCYINRIICIRCNLHQLENIKSNIQKLRRYMEYIRHYKELVESKIKDEFIEEIVEKLGEYERNLGQINSLIGKIETENTEGTLDINPEVTKLTSITRTITSLKGKIGKLMEVQTTITQLQTRIEEITTNIESLELKIKGLESSIESVVKTFLQCSNVLLTFNVCRIMTHTTNHKNHTNMSINIIISVVFRV